MRICIARSKRFVYSETFIRDQISGFTELADVYSVHSGRLPERHEDGRLLMPLPYWIINKIVRLATGERNNYFGEYGLRKFLRSNRVDLVLANYGLTGAHIAPICQDLKIPLIVIFHGHDATSKSLLIEYSLKYQKLFSIATSIIAVSEAMRTKIIALGAPDWKVSVVPCGVDVNKFQPMGMPSLKHFLSVGRFVEKKGHCTPFGLFILSGNNIPMLS